MNIRTRRPTNGTAGKTQLPPAEIPDVYYLETFEQLQVLSDPLRYKIIRLLSRPRTGAQLARLLGVPRAKIHYHLKLLEGARLIRLHGTDAITGIVEKYYVVVARMLDFQHLMPELETLNQSDVTIATYRAMADFLATMLDVSRESLLRSPTNVRRDEGVWMDFDAVATADQFATVRERFAALKQEIITMTGVARRSDDASLKRFHITLYLTPDTRAVADPAVPAVDEPDD